MIQTIYYQRGAPDPVLENNFVLTIVRQYAPGAKKVTDIDETGGVYPVEIMAHTLRLFSQGVKVCVEIGAMALDAGAIREPRAVVVLGGSGSGKGVDTACVITPGYSANIFETRVHELLCKPY